MHGVACMHCKVSHTHCVLNNCAQVVHVRELVMAKVFNPTHYLDHATFDCGEVPQVTGSPLAAQTR